MIINKPARTKIVLFFHFCCIGVIFCGRSEGASSPIDLWKNRFEKDMRAADRDDFIVQMTIPLGLALLGRVEEAISKGSELADGEFRSKHDVEAEVVGTLTSIGKLNDALTIAEGIEDTFTRNTAIAAVAQEKIARGDTSGGLKLLAQIQGKQRDHYVSTLIYQEMDEQQFGKASEYLAMVVDDEKRVELKRLIEQERSLPSIDDPAFVEKRLEIAIKDYAENDLKNIDSANRSSRILLVEAMLRHLLSAKQFFHLKDQSSCHEELQASLKFANRIEGKLERIGELTTVATTSYKFGETKLAHEILAQVVQKPEFDGSGILNKDLMDAVAELLTDQELEPLVRRWQTAEQGYIDCSRFSSACGRLGRLDRLEWLYDRTEDTTHRLLINVAAIQLLVKQKVDRVR